MRWDYLKELRATDDATLCKRLRGEYPTAKYKPEPICLEAAKRIEALSVLAYQRWNIANARIQMLEAELAEVSTARIQLLEAILAKVSALQK